MRKADVDHAWEKCRNAELPRLAINELAFPFGDGVSRLTIDSRVSAFVGRNGAGKTSMLRALQQLLGPGRVVSARMAIGAVSGRYNGRNFSVPEAAGDAQYAPPVVLIDASAQAHKLMDFFRAQIDLDEVIASFGLRRSSTREAEPFRYLCGRPYDFIETAEVEGAEPASDSSLSTAEPDVLPFFRASLEGRAYDSLSMGFGELCAFYLIWSLNRVRAGSVVVLDEPDSHLSPAARRALSSVVAMIAAERELWIAFTTHSTESLESLRESELYLVDATQGSSSHPVSAAGPRRRAIRSLGIAPIKRLLIVVEDVDAEEVAAQIVNKYAEDVSGAVDIQRLVAGATEVVRFVDMFPAQSRIGRCIALLDGDKRADFATNANVLFLPGRLDPIAAARATVSIDPAPFAVQLGIDSVRLSTALRSVRAADHHDFCAALLEELRLEAWSVPSVRRALVNAWLADASVTEEAKLLVAHIVERVDRLPFVDWGRSAG